MFCIKFRSYFVTWFSICSLFSPKLPNHCPLLLVDDIINLFAINFCELVFYVASEFSEQLFDKRIQIECVSRCMDLFYTTFRDMFKSLLPALNSFLVFCLLFSLKCYFERNMYCKKLHSKATVNVVSG